MNRKVRRDSLWDIKEGDVGGGGVGLLPVFYCSIRDEPEGLCLRKQ